MFREIVRELNKASDSDNPFDFLQNWINNLPLDEHKFCLSVLRDLEQISEQNQGVTVTEKLRVVSAMWAAFKADKMLADLARHGREPRQDETIFLDYIRKREETALKLISDLRESTTSGLTLEELRKEIDEIHSSTSNKKPTQKRINIEDE